RSLPERQPIGLGRGGAARLGGIPEGQGRRKSSESWPKLLGGFGGTSLVVGVRWSFRGKDAGSPDSSAIGATEDAASGRAARPDDTDCVSSNPPTARRSWPGERAGSC